MNAPYEYSRFCGPRALAAVTGKSRRECAALLWPLRFFWWEGAAPTASAEGELGTPEQAVGDALLRLGFGIDSYRWDGTMTADSAVYAAALREQAEQRIYEVRQLRHPAAPTPDASASDSPAPSPGPRLPGCRPLQEWLQRHRAGCWLYVVENNGANPHVLAAWGRRILTGEALDLVGDWEVLSALRVHPPRPQHPGETHV